MNTDTDTTEAKFEQDVWDICRDTIIRGEIGYWARCEVGERTIVVHETEYDAAWKATDGKVESITKRSLMRTVDSIARGVPHKYVGPQIVKWIAGAKATGDAGDFDATCADVVIQITVLGEVVYG